jgi:hypothetical protein
MSGSYDTLGRSSVDQMIKPELTASPIFAIKKLNGGLSQVRATLTREATDIEVSQAVFGGLKQ